MIVELIQLSLTPVFILVAIGSILNFLTTRLARVVDRSRVLREQHGNTSGAEHDAVVREMRIVSRRIDLTGRAILMLVLSGLAIGVTVVVLFVAGWSAVNLDALIVVTFILAVALLLAGLVMFLIETRQASAALKIPDSYLEFDRKIETSDRN